MVSNELLTEQIGIILKEATEKSLHQEFDGIFSERIVNYVLNIDTTNKKKFAEWVLKNSMNDRSTLNDFLFDGIINKLFNATQKGEFQIFSYNNIEEAWKDYLEFVIDNKPMSAVYEDNDTAIYIPETANQLRNALLLDFEREPNKIKWCVASNGDRESWWNKYTAHNSYNLYLILDKRSDLLYLWNECDDEDSEYYNMPLYTEFSNEYNVPVDPMRILSPGAVNWLDKNSRCDVNMDEIWEMYNNPELVEDY